MRCKKHISDFSSGIGVCASCLRERLFYLIEVQAQTNDEAHIQAAAQTHLKPRGWCPSLHHHQAAAVQSSSSSSQLQQHQPSRFDDRRNPNPPPPPLVFPRSVSPYISRRKSEKPYGPTVDESSSPAHHHQLFFSTPQLGPTYRTTPNDDINYKQGETEAETNHPHHHNNNNNNNNNNNKKKKKWSKLPVISDLIRLRSRWRSKSNHNHHNQPDSPVTDPGPRVSSHLHPSTSDITTTATTSTTSKKTMVRMFSLNAPTATRAASSRRQILRRDRGMSPDYNDDEEEYEEEEELATITRPDTPEQWRRTPNLNILRTSQGRFRASPGRSSFGSVANSWGLCLSPLVRASPVSRPMWNGGGGGGCAVLSSPSSLAGGKDSGEIKPHLSTNRSRKIANFGRCNRNR